MLGLVFVLLRNGGAANSPSDTTTIKIDQTQKPFDVRVSNVSVAELEKLSQGNAQIKQDLEQLKRSIEAVSNDLKTLKR
jgi:hypothetical protein